MKKLLLFIGLFLGVLLLTSSCKKDESTPINQTNVYGYVPNLFPIIVGNKTGYINQTGTIVITPQFDTYHKHYGNTTLFYLPRFMFGMTIVPKEITTDNFKFGYIDTKGTQIVSSMYYDAGDFSNEGLAYVSNSVDAWGNLLYGYIDKTGGTKISSQFMGAGYFHQGLAAVATGYVTSLGDSTYRVGYINVSGTIAITPTYSDGNIFNEGYASVRNTTDGKWGFIDNKGNLKVGFIYYDHTTNDGLYFIDGLAAVSQAINNIKMWGFIKPDGNTAIPFTFQEAQPFFEGLAAVDMGSNGVGNWGFIDKTGKVVINPQFKYTNGFSEGLASVKTTTNYYGYIDSKGAFVIPAQYKDADDFINGTARVTFTDNTWGYINKKATVIWKSTMTVGESGTPMFKSSPRKGNSENHDMKEIINRRIIRN
jgi:hypothetical protein